MKIKGIIISFIFVIGILSFKSSDDINYEHPKIAKEVKKYFTSDVAKLEIIIPDSIADDFSLNGKLFSLQKDSTKAFLWVGRVFSCKSEGCTDPSQFSIVNQYEYFDYMILFNDQNTVQKVKVFSYKATHGQEVCSKGWLKQFIGFKGDSKLRYGKEVDAISGATISAENITLNIQEVSKLVLSL